MSIFNRNYLYSRNYTGNVKALIFDWGGTTADKYVISPAKVFVDTFKKYNVPISMKEARGPMGIRKDLHIKTLLEMPEIKERWKNLYNREPDQSDVDKMYKDFIPMQIECLKDHTTLLPNTAMTIQLLRDKYNVKIGSTTGFNKAMVDILLEDAAKQGYVPDCTVAGDEVINGSRPKPFMIYKNMDELDIHPIQSVVKIDDTITGIHEALEAGCWGIGIARWSNYMNINTLEEEALLSENEIEERLNYSREILTNSGAHYVIDTIDELPQVIEDINKKLNYGISPN